MPRKMRWAQVRRMTDSGEMDDKVDHPDPATAPLGTDEEAGGFQTPPEDIAESEEGRKRTRKGEGDDTEEDPNA